MKLNKQESQIKSDSEKNLIEDVAWMRGKLETFFEQIAPTLATKESVDAVGLRLTEHCEGHKDNRNLLPVWVGIAISGVAGVSGFLLSFMQKGAIK